MPRIIARGDGWTVADVLCTSGPQDRPFEERHTHYTIAIVRARCAEDVRYSPAVAAGDDARHRAAGRSAFLPSCQCML